MSYGGGYGGGGGGYGGGGRGGGSGGGYGGGYASYGDYGYGGQESYSNGYAQRSSRTGSPIQFPHLLFLNHLHYGHH